MIERYERCVFVIKTSNPRCTALEFKGYRLYSLIEKLPANELQKITAFNEYCHDKPASDAPLIIDMAYITLPKEGMWSLFRYYDYICEQAPRLAKA